MKPQRVDPFTGVFNFLIALSSGERPIQIANTVLGGVTIDTSIPSDTHIPETGIKRDSIEGEWVIVEQYPNEEVAKQGHNKWVMMMTEDPDFPLIDIDIWSLCQDKEEG